MVILRTFGAAFWDWVHHRAILVVATCVSAACAVRADFKAMTWCIVPSLQMVRKLRMLTMPVSFKSYLIIQLCATVLQVFTIQSNAWFMMDAVKDPVVLELWVFLWDNSYFNFVPPTTWERVVTPKRLAIALWCLSTGQLFLPLVTGMPLPGTKTPRISRLLKSVESSPSVPRDGSPQDMDPLILKEHQGSQNRDSFLPEKYSSRDFMTIWSTLCREFFEVWGFRVHKCTYRESVAKLAFASGLRCTGSLSLSYSIHCIDEILRDHKGFKVRTSQGFESSEEGWELQAVDEFQQLLRIRLDRVCFVMFTKLALQTNLQITFLVIRRIQANQTQESVTEKLASDIAEIFSITSLLLTFLVELLDVAQVTRIFLNVRKQVRRTAKGQVDNEGRLYAFRDRVTNDNSTQTIPYCQKQLKDEYYAAVRTFWEIIFVTTICTCLIGFALLVAFKAVSCDDVAWSLASGCLHPIFKNEA